jgi:hypothetical protein
VWAIAIGDLGLSDEFFWSLSPNLFARLHERYRERLKHEDYRAGMIAATLVNVQRSKDSDKFWTPADFFPDVFAPAPERTDDQSFELRTIARLRAWKHRAS